MGKKERKVNHIGILKSKKLKLATKKKKKIDIAKLQAKHLNHH